MLSVTSCFEARGYQSGQRLAASTPQKRNGNGTDKAAACSGADSVAGTTRARPPGQSASDELSGGSTCLSVHSITQQTQPIPARAKPASSTDSSSTLIQFIKRRWRRRRRELHGRPTGRRLHTINQTL